MTGVKKNQKKIRQTALVPRRLCETKAGNLAYIVGRIIFRPGRPMLVEHIGGVYLEHDLTGAVVTPGFDDDYAITHVFEGGNCCAA